MRKLILALLGVEVALFLLISGFLILGAEGRLFVVDPANPAIDAANAIVSGQAVSQEGIVAILKATSEQLFAERQRIKSLGGLARELGLILLALSVLQGLLVLYVVRGRRKEGDKGPG